MMATRKPRTVTLTAPKANGRSRGPTVPPSPVPPIDMDEQGPPPSPIAAGEQDNLMGLMATLAGAATATVTIYRVIKNRPLAYVFECSPDSFSMDQLRDEYGGGEFRVYIHIDGELQKNIRVMVEPKPKTTDETPALAALREGLDRQGKLLEALTARVAAPAPPAPGLASMLGGATLPETLTAFGALLQILRPPAPPPPPVQQESTSGAIDMLMKGIQLAKDLREEGGGGESTLLDVVRDMLKSPMLLQAVESAANQPKLPAPTTANGRQVPMRRGPAQHGPITASARQPAVTDTDRPPAATAPAADASEVVEGTAEVSPAKLSDPQMAQMVQHYMGVLTAQAAADSDPELYAGLILDQLPDEAIIMLLDREPDPVSALIADYPPAEPYREWFEAVVAYVEQAFADDGPPGVQLEGSGHVEGDSDATGSGEAGLTG
jgi:hypothetical protein